MNLRSGDGPTTKARSKSITLATDEILEVSMPEANEFRSLGTGIGVWLDPGGAIPTENDPNTTMPARERVFRILAPYGTVPLPSQGSLRGWVVDGTSLGMAPWVFDDVKQLWVRLGAAASITSANGTGFIIASLGAGFLGAKIFIQIASNTGGVTKAAYGFF